MGAHTPGPRYPTANSIRPPCFSPDLPSPIFPSHLGLPTHCPGHPAVLDLWTQALPNLYLAAAQPV